MLRHENFAPHGSVRQQATTERAKGTLATLDQIAKQEPSLELEELAATSVSHMASIPTNNLDDPREWGLRHRNIKFANPKPPLNRVLRWVREAAEEHGWHWRLWRMAASWPSNTTIGI